MSFVAVFTHKQLWETIADQLREDILATRIPAGSRLLETELAERFGVSRGPIRDALTELAREGLVEDLPRRGTFVAALTESDLEEVYWLRRAIEEAAVRLAIARAEDADIDEMYDRLAETEEAYGAGDLSAAWEADMAFHRSYCLMSDNGRLVALFEDLASQTVLLMRTALNRRASIAWTPPVELHRKIADAIRDRDEEAAVQAVAQHFQYTHHRLEAVTPTERAG